MRSKIRNAFRKGLENVTSQEKGLNLEHIGFRNIDDQETHAELIIKALANEYNYQNFIVANSHSPDQFAPPDDPNEAHHSSLFFKIENYLSARFRSNILELIADHGLFPDASLAVLSADNLVKGCGSKFQSALMTPEEILTTFFNDDNISFLNFIGRNEKIFLDFAENFTPSVLKLYFANLPRSLEFVALLMRSANFIDLDMDKVLDLYKRSVIANPRHISTSRNLLVRWTSYLDELLQLGKVSLSQVIELHRDLRSKGVNLDFGYLKNALKSEKTDFMQVADFCREQLDNPETVKDSFGILLHLSELGKFGVEDIIQLCGELSNNEDTEKAVFSNLGKFAPLISSGKISSDVVANFYKSALKKEKKINYEPIVALRDLANLIPSGHIDPNVVLDLFYDVLATKESFKHKELVLVSLAKAIPSGKINPDAVINFCRELIDRGNYDEQVALDSFLDELGKVASEGYIDSEKVIKLHFAFCSRAIRGLAEGIASGNVNTESLLTLVEFWSDFPVDQRSGKYAPFSAAAQSLGNLSKGISSGKIDSKRIINLYHKIIEKQNGQGGGSPVDLASLAEAILSGKVQSKEVIAIYDKAISQGGITLHVAARDIGSLADIIPSGKINANEVMRLYADSLKSKEERQLCNSMQALTKLISLGFVEPTEVVAVYDNMFKNNCNYILSRSLHFLARELPEEAEKIYLSIIERDAKSIKEYNNSIEDNYLAFSDGLLSILDDLENPQGLFNIAMAARAQHYQDQMLKKIFKEEERKIHSNNAERISDFVEKNYKDLKDYERDQITHMLIDLHRFKREHPETFLEGGYTSYNVVSVTDDVVKLALPEQNEAENRIYSLKPNLLEFGKLISEKKGEVLQLDDGLSMLVLANLAKRAPGSVIAGKIFRSLTEKNILWKTGHMGHDAAMLNLFMLGLAHKEIRLAAEETLTEFPDVKYGTPFGMPHYEAIKSPLEETSNNVYRTLMRTVPQSLIRESGRIISNFVRYAELNEDLPIILGDNKIIENTCNEYMLDFAVAGHGLEIDDITYGLVEPRLGIPVGATKNYVKAYVEMRSLHDPEFAAKKDLHKKEMLALTDPSILKSLSVYASCTRKRVKQMESGEITARRNYFINAMHYMLKNGDFSDFR